MRFSKRVTSGVTWNGSTTIRGMGCGRLRRAVLNLAAVGNCREIVEGVAGEARTSGSPTEEEFVASVTLASSNGVGT